MTAGLTEWPSAKLGRFLAARTQSVTPAKEPERTFELYSVPSHETGRPEIVRGMDIGSAKQTVRPNDVLICKINPRINRVWVVNARSEHEQIGSTEWIRFPFSDDLVPEFLAYHLQRESVRDHLAMNASGVGGSLMRVKPSTLANEEIPLPPIDVQRRIVARMDELFCELGDGEEELARARADLEIYRKALLKAAVTGELTADWRSDNRPRESGVDFVARLRSEQHGASVRGRRVCYPSQHTDSPDWPHLPQLPDTWAWGRVEDAGEVVTGATPPTSDTTSYGGDVPFYTPGDLDAGRKLDATRRTLTERGLRKVRGVPAGSVLVTCIGATIGKTGFNARAGATNQQINTIVPTVPEHGKFIFYYFDGPGRRLVTENASSTTLPILNKGAFSRLPLPFPSPDEAVVIAKRVDEMLEEADEMLAAIQDAEAAAANLRQSILAAAFRGELVQ